MVRNKKVLAGAAALVLAGSAVFAQEFSASNEVSSDIVKVVKDQDTTFAGITEKISAEYKAALIDFKLVLPVAFDVRDFTVVDSDKTYKDKFNIHFTNDVSAYFDFRPVEYVTLVMNFNDTINTPGSYLPVKDGNLSSGDIGPDVGLVLRPIAGMRIAGGVDIFDWTYPTSGTWFGVDDLDPRLHFGADYAYGDLITVGVSLINIVSDDREIGAHVKLNAVDNLTVTAGFTYQLSDALFGVNYDYVGGAGDKNMAIDAGLSYDLSDTLPLVVAADFAIGLKDKYAGAEKTSLYLGAKGTYQVSDELSVALPVKFGTVFDVDDSWGLEVAPSELTPNFRTV